MKRHLNDLRRCDNNYYGADNYKICREQNTKEIKICFIYLFIYLFIFVLGDGEDDY